MPPPAAESGAQARKAILIVDDHPMLRRGLAALLESEPSLSVCGNAATCAAALEAVRAQRPDLVILDLELERGTLGGLELIAALAECSPPIPALVLSMHDEAVYAERALRAGARGYVTKQQLDDTVLDAVRRVLEGDIYMSPRLADRLAAKYLGVRTLAADSPLQVLTNRELQVFQLVGHGKTTRQIAEELHLSIKTIESHSEHIKQKLGLESRAAMVRSATHWVAGGHMR